MIVPFFSFIQLFFPYRPFLFKKSILKMKRGGEKKKKKNSPIELAILGEIRLSGYLA